MWARRGLQPRFNREPRGVEAGEVHAWRARDSETTRRAFSVAVVMQTKDEVTREHDIWALQQDRFSLNAARPDNAQPLPRRTPTRIVRQFLSIFSLLVYGAPAERPEPREAGNNNCFGHVNAPPLNVMLSPPQGAAEYRGDACKTLSPSENPSGYPPPAAPGDPTSMEVSSYPNTYIPRKEASNGLSLLLEGAPRNA